MIEKNLVFVADTAPLCDARLFERLYGTVSKERQKKIDRLKNEKEKRLSLGAYALLMCALSRFDIKNISLKYGEEGKPYLSGYDGVYFSLSHSEERVMCVLSPLEVGCDVEFVQDRSLSVAERFFASDEVTYIKRLADDRAKKEAFFRLWTLKESFVKALGKGLTLPLDSFSFDISGESVTVRQKLTQKNLYFKEYYLGDLYKGAVCSQHPLFGDVEIVIFD